MNKYLINALSFLCLMSYTHMQAAAMSRSDGTIDKPAVEKKDSEIEAKKESAPRLSIRITGSDSFSSQTIEYNCDGKNVAATYINADDIALVQLDFVDKTIVAANVIAASGAKYTGDRYSWWEHKDGVSLYNLMTDPEEQNPIICRPR